MIVYVPEAATISTLSLVIHCNYPLFSLPYLDLIAATGDCLQAFHALNL